MCFPYLLRCSQYSLIGLRVDEPYHVSDTQSTSSCDDRPLIVSGSVKTFLLYPFPPPPFPPRSRTCRKVTARLQVTGFPLFSLLPAGRGEPSSARFEEEAREARARERRRVTLEEIDRAKEQEARKHESRLFSLSFSVAFQSTWLSHVVLIFLAKEVHR